MIKMLDASRIWYYKDLLVYLYNNKLSQTVLYY